MLTDLVPHPWQTAAVAAYERHGGLVCWLDAGCGKTYTAAAIARRCRRPLVVAPAGVIAQTMAMFEAYGVKCWPARLWDPRLERSGAVYFASYTWLQQAAQAEFFTRFRPSDVLLDEFHLCRNLRTNSAAKRLNRYLVDNWAVRVGVFTASPWGTRLEDVAAGLRFALRKAAPVPPTADGVAMLSERLATDPAARAAWFARLAATPGVFLDSDGAGAYPGKVEIRVVRREPCLLLNDAWELPDGWLLGSASEAAQAARGLAWGFYRTRDPRPTPAFLEARRAWGQVVRRVIDRGAADTESQVRELRPAEYAEYQAVAERQPGFTETAVWVDESVVSFVREYLWDKTKLPQFASGPSCAAQTPAGCGPESSTATIDTGAGGPERATFSHTAMPGACTTVAPSPKDTKSVTAATCRDAATQSTSSSALTVTTCETPGARGGSVGVSDSGATTSGQPYDGPRILVWVYHVALGQKLSSALGVPYHRDGGLDAAGTRLDEARAPVVVVSMSACSAGWNAQWYNTNLVLEPRADQEQAKQLIARTARQGQPSPVVTVDLVVNCPQAEFALRQSIERGRVGFETTGKQNPLLQLEGREF